MKVKKQFKGYPVLLAYQVSDKQLAVWCPYCVDWHYHGLNSTHVVAHCINEASPFKKGGYVVQQGTAKDYKEIIQ